jgi:hypothetical protein
MGFGSLVLSLRSAEDHRRRAPPADLGGSDLKPGRLRPRRSSEPPQPIAREAIDDSTSTCPEHRSNTHGAWLTGCVDGTARQHAEKVLPLEDSNELGLGMSRHVMISIHTVASFRDDLAIYRKESTKWVISLPAGFFCQCKGPGEQGTVIHTVEASQSRPPGPSIVSSASATRPGTHR